jgi:hypothetical protein
MYKKLQRKNRKKRRKEGKKERKEKKVAIKRITMSEKSTRPKNIKHTLKIN